MAGGVSPSLVLAMVGALPSGCKTVAMMQGGEDWVYYFGLDSNSRVLAGIYDAVNLNTRATGFYKTPPKFKPWPSPEELAELSRGGEKKATSMLDWIDMVTKASGGGEE